MTDPPLYIIDDEPEMCRSLALLLATNGVPAQTFGSADLFLDMLDHLPPGIVICDVVMPGTSGIEFIGKLTSRRRRDPVVVVAGHADIALAVEAMKAGAHDFVEKPFSADTIRVAIDSAIRRLPHDPLDHLSRRERQVLDAIVAGLTAKETARELGISPRTIETYRAKLLEKTGASTTAQLIRIGIEASRTSLLPANGQIRPHGE